MKNRIYVGIDIGKSGGIVALHMNKILHQEVMPLIGGEDVDVHRIMMILNSLTDPGTVVHVVLERFAGFFGYSKSSTISLSRASGMIEATLLLKGVPHTRVPPKAWQKEMFENVKELTNSKGQRDTKRMALIAASKLFPKECFMPSARYKKAHDGLVDAALLALYGSRKGF